MYVALGSTEVAKQVFLKCPSLSGDIIFADDAKLAARLSALLSMPGCYLPVVDGPRMQRPDFQAEVIHRNNAVARAQAKRVVFAGLEEQSLSALAAKFPPRMCVRVEADADLETFNQNGVDLNQPLVWGRDRVGVGLLQALRKKRAISFEDKASPRTSVESKSGHLVVCQEGDDISEAIAANYAFSLGAGLVLLPETSKDGVERTLERFYSVYDSREKPASLALKELREELRQIVGDISVPAGGSITFITDGLPFGFAFPEVPSTHLFGYPALGLSIIHGFAAEIDGRGVQVAALVNPETTPAPEIRVAVEILSEQRMFVRVYEGSSADVTSISELVELFPYDLLIIATHCGDVSGHRWTYEFTDSEDIERKLVVDIALGIGRTSDTDLLQVSEFIRFVSLDGVDWNDPAKGEKVYVGNAILDFIERIRIKEDKDDELKPTIKDLVPRVVGSAAMKMHDHNFLAFPRSVAGGQTPIIINNACVSWHRLAGDFVFGGARGYVGTLFPISTTEAEDVLLRALRKHHGKFLPHAFWSAQRESYGDDPRRPYVVAGVYTQRIRTYLDDVPAHIAKELRRGFVSWRKMRDEDGAHDPQRQRTLERHVEFYERELRHFTVEYRPERGRRGGGGDQRK